MDQYKEYATFSDEVKPAKIQRKSMVERLGLKVTNVVSKAGKKADSSYFCFKTKTIDASLQDIFEVHNRQKQID